MLFELRQKQEERQDDKMKDRPVTTSVSILSSDLDKLEKIAINEGFRSRNQLIMNIVSSWLKNYAQQNAK